MSRSNAAAALLLRRKGDGSTLNLDFTKMSALDSRFTFTRSTTATYIDSSGYVATMAAAATNDPTKARLDYNPTTLAPSGLLIEGASTNLTKRSDNAFTNTYWNDTGNNTTAVDSAVTSPTGVALTASTLTENAGTSLTRHIHQTVGEFTPTVSTSYTMSAWVKQPASAAVRYVQLAFWVAGFGATAYMNYDIQAGTIGTGGAAITASTITAYPSGWYRITATAPATATGSSGFQLGFSTTSSAVRTESYTVSGGSEKAIYLWGAQVESGTGASSYIPTVASQVTRAADFCKMTEAASQMSWLQKIDTCTFFVDFMPMTQRGAFNSLVRLITTTSQGHEFYVYDTVAGVSLTTSTKITASTNQEQTLAQSMALNSRHKVAYSIDATNGLRSHNGSTISAANPNALPTGTRSTFGIGSTGLDASAMSGWIRAFKYYPTALTQAQINGLTT